MPRHSLRLRQAFPSYLTKELDELFSLIDFDSRLEPTNARMDVMVGNEQVNIASRVYFEHHFGVPHLSEIQYLLYTCLYTRHHNGYMREAALRRLFQSNAANIEWVVPFVVQLAAEYVENILLLIDDQLPYLNKTTYRNFLRANPEYFYKTKQRIVSYWDCYYRRQRPHFSQYVGGRITAYLDGLLKSSN